MTKQLHILNGQTTLHLFRESKITGETFVWDEILSDGPVLYEVASEQFWQVRREFVVATFGQGATGYSNLVAGFEKVRGFNRYEEVVLWYEYDLFCQVNLIALLSWFYNQKALNKVKISLICVGKEPGYNRLVGLGQLPVRRYPELLEKRKALSEANLRYADTVWNSYADENPAELSFACVPHPIFQYLGKSIQAHLERFPDHTGLSVIEREILQSVSGESLPNVDFLVRHMLQWQHYYGFGDLQYYYYIKSLKPFIEFGDTLTLNEIGKKSLEEQLDRKSFPSLNLPYGGSRASEYRRTSDGFEKMP